MSIYDPSRIFPVVECPYLPGPRFEVTPEGITEAERLVSEPIRDKANYGISARATARNMIEKQLRIAHTNAVSQFHGLRSKSDVAELRDPTEAETRAVRARLAGEPNLATLCRKVAELRGILLWLSRLDSRDGVAPKEAAHGNSFPGVSQSGPSIKNAGFIPIGLR